MRTSVLSLGVTTAAIVLALKAVLRLPGVPYNVSELFLDSGSALSAGALFTRWAAVQTAAVAVIVAGAGIAARLTRA